jgi:hypothetical protein
MRARNASPAVSTKLTAPRSICNDRSPTFAKARRRAMLDFRYPRRDQLSFDAKHDRLFTFVNGDSQPAAAQQMVSLVSSHNAKALSRRCEHDRGVLHTPVQGPTGEAYRSVTSVMLLRHTCIITWVMARGWESKSVEDQQADASRDKASPRRLLTPDQVVRETKLEGIRLSRARVLQQLAATHDPRHRRMLEDALAELDRRLLALRTPA